MGNGDPGLGYRHRVLRRLEPLAAHLPAHQVRAQRDQLAEAKSRLADGIRPSHVTGVAREPQPVVRRHEVLTGALLLDLAHLAQPVEA